MKIVSVAADKNMVGAASSNLMRMPAVAAIFEKAMVDKRVRVEDSDYEQPIWGAKQPRIERPATRSGSAAGPSQRQPPQVLTDTTPEPDSSDDEDAIVVQPGTKAPSSFETPRQTQAPDSVPGASPRPPEISKKGITVRSMF